MSKADILYGSESLEGFGNFVKETAVMNSNNNKLKKIFAPFISWFNGKLYSKRLEVTDCDYDNHMDEDCILICNKLNSLKHVRTYESCSGHFKHSFNIFFRCDDFVTLARLSRSVNPNYSDGKWEILVDDTDTNPTNCFWLRSRKVFEDQIELNKSVLDLVANINYWLNPVYDDYFKQKKL